MIAAFLVQVQPSTQGLPYTVYATLGAAIIAALASLTSALISFKTKDKEFKNDYYKKIIDKRLSAYQQVELILFDLSSVTEFTLMKDGKAIGVGQVFDVFQDNGEFDKFIIKLKQVISYRFWLSPEFEKQLVSLHSQMVDIADELNLTKGATASEVDLAKVGVKYFDDIDAARLRIETLFRKEIVEIQDVKKFFGALYNKEMATRKVDIA